MARNSGVCNFGLKLQIELHHLNFQEKLVTFFRQKRIAVHEFSPLDAAFCEELGTENKDYVLVNKKS